MSIDTDDNLSERLAFLELDQKTCSTLSSLRPTLAEIIGGALDKFYAKIAATPKLKRFFSDKAQIGRAHV